MLARPCFKLHVQIMKVPHPLSSSHYRVAALPQPGTYYISGQSRALLVMVFYVPMLPQATHSQRLSSDELDLVLSPRGSDMLLLHLDYLATASHYTTALLQCIATLQPTKCSHMYL